jgi:hypothetical protein
VRLHVVGLLILFALSACDKKEGEIALPSMVTENVQMSSALVTFKGSISNVKGTVEEYGFVWGDVVTPDKYFSVNLGSTASDISFQYTLPNTFTQGEQYFFKTYVTIGGNKYFGNLVSFTRTTPSLISFSPMIGFPGTEVVLEGKNFIEGDTRVLFANVEAEVISVEPTQVVVRVPDGVSPGNIVLSVIIKEETITAADYFLYKLLSITGISPLKGSYEDVITITGTGFNSVSDWYQVTLGGEYVQVVEKSDTQMKILVPPAMISQFSHVRMYNYNEEVVYATPFELLPPEFNFSPKTGTFRDQILITGKNFHPISHYNRVFLGDQQVYIIESTTTFLRIEVPDNLLTSFGLARPRFELGPYSVIAAEDFVLTPHSITDISPTTCRRGDEITITGEFFNPSIELNHVHIGSLAATIVEGSTTHLKFKLPPTVTAGEYELKVTVGGREVVYSQMIAVTDPWTQKASIPNGGRYGAVAFSIGGKGYIGGGYHTNGGFRTDFYEYDPSSDTWTRKADMPIVGYGMTAFSTSGSGYVLYAKQLWQYDPEGNAWTPRAGYPGNGSYWQSAFVIGDRVFAGTGSNDWGYRYSDFFEYSEAQDKWYSRTSYYQEASHGIGFAAGGKGYFTFGMWIHRDIYEYSPANNNWAFKRELNSTVAGLSNMRVNALAIPAGAKAYFGTGSNDASTWGEFYSDLYEFDPTTNTCNRLTDMPGKGRINAVGFFINGKLYAGTGLSSNPDHEWLSDFYEYDPEKE